VVGEDGEEDREDELDGCLRGWDDVDELDGVLSCRFEPEGEGLDGAGGLLWVVSVCKCLRDGGEFDGICKNLQR
jgi:hypothetical protein